MSHKELAAELGISYLTLYRRIKKLDPVFQEQIKGRRVLFEEHVKYIHQNMVLGKPSDKGLGKEEMEKLRNRLMESLRGWRKVYPKLVDG